MKYIDVKVSHGCRQAQGGVIVTRGRGWLARLAGGLAGFPPAGEMPLRLTVTGDEVWTRQFGTHRFTTRLSARDGRYHFDVALWHWLTGPIIGYRGSLTPEPAGGHVPAHPAAGYPPPAPS